MDSVIYQKQSPIAWITINRPEVMNAGGDTHRGGLQVHTGAESPISGSGEHQHL